MAKIGHFSRPGSQNEFRGIPREGVSQRGPLLDPFFVTFGGLKWPLFNPNPPIPAPYSWIVSFQRGVRNDPKNDTFQKVPKMSLFGPYRATVRGTKNGVKNDPKNDPFLGPLYYRFRRQKRGKMAQNGSKKGSQKWPQKWPPFWTLTVPLTIFDGRARARARPLLPFKNVTKCQKCHFWHVWKSAILLTPKWPPSETTRFRV